MRRRLPGELLAWTLTFVALFASALAPSRAEAGDRPLVVLLVNMTPEPTDAARRCFAQVRSAIAAEYTTVRRIGESAARRRAGGPSGDMMSWDRAAFASLSVGPSPGDLDAVVLIDCRPDARRADVVVYNAAGDISQLRLRDVGFDRRRATWLAAAILRHGWVGFSP